jgi:hypothetical protein
MRVRLTNSITCVALGCLVARGGQSNRASSEGDAEAGTLKLGRQFTKAFYSGDLEPLWNRMTLEMRGPDASAGSVEELRNVSRQSRRTRG